MPRPLKAGLDYFSIDCDFFTASKKIKSLRRAHGPIGILTYLSILCKVYGGNGYYYRFDQVEELAMDIAEEIAGDQVRRTATSVTESIFYLVKQGMLDKSLFEQGVITGVALQERYVIAATAAKRKLDMSLYCLLTDEVITALQKGKKQYEAGGSMPETTVNSEETTVNSEETTVNSELSTQRKSKKKVKEYSLSEKAREGKTFGVYQNVILTEEEYMDIREKIPETDKYIDRFSEKLFRHGYQYGSHYEAILSWWNTDKERAGADSYEKKTGRKEGDHGSYSSFETDEFFRAALKKSQEALGRKGD